MGTRANYLFQRALAAFFAIADRFFGLSAASRAALSSTELSERYGVRVLSALFQLRSVQLLSDGLPDRRACDRGEVMILA